MVDLSALDAILSARNGVWATFLLLCVLAWRGWTGLPAVMQQWIERRKAIQAAKDADWIRIRDRLESVETRHDECERNLAAEREQRHRDVSSLRDEIAAERAERMRVERLLFAEGEIKQAQAMAQGEVRADPAKSPEAMKSAERVRHIRENGKNGNGNG
jgi:hypothetical protein